MILFFLLFQGGGNIGDDGMPALNDRALNYGDNLEDRDAYNVEDRDGYMYHGYGTEDGYYDGGLDDRAAAGSGMMEEDSGSAEGDDPAMNVSAERVCMLSCFLICKIVPTV